MKHNILLYAVIFISLFAFWGCATQTTDIIENPPGFLKGLLHGFIILFSFIGSLFADFEIYAFPNNGVWYDFGFIIGASAFFGGGGAGAKRKRRNS